MTTPAPREGLSVEPRAEYTCQHGKTWLIEGWLMHAGMTGCDTPRYVQKAQPLPVEPDLRAALEQVRVALKGARGLAADAAETALDFELGEAIDEIDRILEGEYSARLAAPVDPGEDVVERLPDGIIRNGDRALTPPHRDDDKLCGCDSCMEYWAEDEGVNWSRLIPQRRVALRVMDSGDDRLEPLRTAFVENIEGSAQGEIDARRVPGLLRVEGSIGSTLHVGTDYRVVEIREHHEPSGIEGEPPIVTTVIRFDPILAPVDRVGGEGPERE